MTLTRALVTAAALALAQPGFAQTAPDSPPDTAPASALDTAPDTAQAATPEASGAPASGTYAFDPQHSHILFSYDHMGFSTSTGMVRGVTGEVTLDPADPAKSSVTASFPLSGLITVAQDFDAHLMRSEEFLGNAPADATVTFTSTSVEPSGDDHASVTGDLTLNGTTQPVTLDVILRKSGAHPVEQKPAAGFAATGTIKRSDFGLGAFAPAVGDEVAITIAVEAMKP